MTVNEIFNKYNSLCYGRLHPTHLWVGQEIWDYFSSLGGFPWRDGGIGFEDAVMLFDCDMPELAIHFHNEERPHDPRFNAYMELGPVQSRVLGLEV